MNKKALFVSLLAAQLPSISMAQKATITVDVSHPTHAISPTLFGIFLEDINLSVDGGLYPEQVRNRSFEDTDTQACWKFDAAKGKAEVAKANLKN